jgi:hypothetical protein
MVRVWLGLGLGLGLVLGLGVSFALGWIFLRYKNGNLILKHTF